MRLERSTLLFAVIEAYPFIMEHLESLSPLYTRLRDPEMRAAMASVATIEMASALGGLEPQALMLAIRDGVRARTGTELEVEGAQNGPDVGGKEELRDIIRLLHEGSTADEVKERFLALARDVDGSEIARMEQQLMDEGVPQREIERLCDVHVDVFRTSLDRNEPLDVPPGHPLDTYMRENRELEGLLKSLEPLLVFERDMDATRSADRDRVVLDLIDKVSQVEFHYLRKENQLFPLLEARGLKGPSQVMWSLHDAIRAKVKEATILVESHGTVRAIPTIKELTKALSEMMYKEEKVLFPMALEELSGADWAKVRKGEEQIGYSWIEPPKETFFGAVAREGPEPKTGSISLREGSLTLEQLDRILRALPMDISFVDDQDKVAYYSASEDRIFPRSPGVIGREVRNCHPPKSVHVVERVLEGFKAGRKDPAEFWIEHHGRFLHIRYFPVRDDDGRYLGTLEVTQDVTSIRALTGERRLLDGD
jgi:hypothetical protein